MQLQLCIVWGREGTGSCSCDTKVSPGFTPSLEMDATLSSQCVAVPTKYIKIINNYWRRLSKISWIVSGKQIINIGSPSLFFEYLWEAIEAMCHFQAKAIARRRKVWFHLLMSRVLLAAKQNWTTLRMSRPLYYLWAVICRSRGGSWQMKRKKLNRMIMIIIRWWLWEIA